MVFKLVRLMVRLGAYAIADTDCTEPGVHQEVPPSAEGVVESAQAELLARRTVAVQVTCYHRAELATLKLNHR